MGVAGRLAYVFSFTCNPTHLGCNLLQGSRGHAFEAPPQLLADGVPSLASGRSDLTELPSTSNASLASGRGNLAKFARQPGDIAGE